MRRGSERVAVAVLVIAGAVFVAWCVFLAVFGALSALRGVLG